MMIKIVTFFLIFIAVMAMFGRLRWPAITRRQNGGALPRPKRCDTCGRMNLTGGPCDNCDKKSGGA